VTCGVHVLFITKALYVFILFNLALTWFYLDGEKGYQTCNAKEKWITFSNVLTLNGRDQTA